MTNTIQKIENILNLNIKYSYYQQMEDLKQQKHIINLGKLLVKELDLENGTDTLSKWMSHYLADKISLVERLQEGEEKENAKRECFDIILNLWQNRWKLPSSKRPLEDFEPILTVLDKINPEKKDPYFYRPDTKNSATDKTTNFADTSKYLEIIVEIDKVARIWISFLLQQVALKAKNEDIEALLEDAINISEDSDLEAIHVLLDDIDKFTEKDKKEILQKRIDQLEYFSKLNEFLLEEYRQSLSSYNENTNSI